MQGTGKGVPYESDEQLRQIQHRRERLPPQIFRTDGRSRREAEKHPLCPGAAFRVFPSGNGPGDHPCSGSILLGHCRCPRAAFSESGDRSSRVKILLRGIRGPYPDDPLICPPRRCDPAAGIPVRKAFPADHRQAPRGSLSQDRESPGLLSGQPLPRRHHEPYDQ